MSSVSGQVGLVIPESQKNFDRSMNLILFGVDENRDPNIWHTTVNDVFHRLAGRVVDTVDMFRLGRFCDTKKRPILVKLRRFWDCRILLAAARNLKGSRMFLTRDEPLEVRRKATMERLQRRAQDDGKQVLVDNDRLSIDGTAKFSWFFK